MPYGSFLSNVITADAFIWTKPVVWLYGIMLKLTKPCPMESLVFGGRNPSDRFNGG